MPILLEVLPTVPSHRHEHSLEGQLPFLQSLFEDFALVPMLMHEYAHLVRDPAALGNRLDRLVQLHGHERIAAWKAMSIAGDTGPLVRELLELHYDPAYTRSIDKHYKRLAQALQIEVQRDADDEFDRLAAICISA